MYKITVKINGMMCGMCESHVNEAIRKNFAVKKVTSSAAKGEAVILAQQAIGEEQLRAALAPTGYEMGSVSVEPYEKKGLFGLF
jgi:copper chaperone CopZ